VARRYGERGVSDADMEAIASAFTVVSEAPAAV